MMCRMKMKKQVRLIGKVAFLIKTREMIKNYSAEEKQAAGEDNLKEMIESIEHKIAWLSMIYKKMHDQAHMNKKGCCMMGMCKKEKGMNPPEAPTT